MSELTLQIISEIINVCVIPLLGVLVTYLVKYINSKSKELETQVNNDIAKKYINMLTSTITSCVIATNQTYVESLKKQGKFDVEAQKTAFSMTLAAVQDLLSVEAKEYLSEIYGDLDAYITTQIEAAVNKNKTTIEG
jgi:translation initiation factor 2B subunit (eIF-2B alpha/beta/delta family)